MFSFFNKNTYHPLNTIKISRDILHANHAILQKFHPEAKVCPVLKSNAYGHGLWQVAPIFDSMNCPFLIVDSLFEAYELQKLHVKTPILIMGYTNPINFTHKRIPFHIAVFDLETAQILNTHQPGCKIHLFVDTGMCREGIQLDQLQSFLAQLKKLKNLHLVGLCSHFADADNPNNQHMNNKQIALFEKALTILRKNNIDPIWKHFSASGGAFKLKLSCCNMIRAGLAHYGISPLDDADAYTKKLLIHPALEMCSTLAQIKVVQKDACVGYNGTYCVKKDTTLGLILAGYYEGVDRRLSNKGCVKIRNTYCPIVGRVSMNMTIVDISMLKSPKIGENVVVYSSNPSDTNSITNAAQIAGTIPYELLVHLAESVKRVVV